MKRMNATMILPAECSRRILATTMLIPAVSAYAVHNRLYDCAGVSLAVFATSVNYWRRPTRGMRRNVDRTCVLVALTYFSFVITTRLYPVQRAIHAVLVAIGGLCYRQARRIQDVNWSSLWHCGMHIVLNTSSVYLYSSLIKMRHKKSSP